MLCFSSRSGITGCLSSAARLLACVVVAAGAASVAHAGAPIYARHATIDAYKQFARADLQLEQLDGVGGAFVPSASYPGTYSFTVHSTSPLPGIRQTPLGSGAGNPDQGTVIDFAGLPVGRGVTAFAGTVRVADSLGTTSMGGSVTIQTNTGISFTVTAPVAGQFIAFTTAEPFTSVIISGLGYEYIRDVFIGSSSSAPIAGESCADGPTVGIGQFPFTTANLIGTNTTIPGTCALGGVDTGNDVWFRFVPPANGQVTMTTCGCSFDSVLRVFNSCPTDTSVPTQIACNDDFCASATGNTASQVSFRGTCGVAVLVRISGYNGATGGGNLGISMVADCSADFNHVNGINVQDIFDFLSAWFAGC